MKTRYRLMRRGIRGKTFYCVDALTRKRTSLQTTDRDMVARISIGIVGAIALGLCFLAMRDVPHNTAIRSPQPTMTILWVLVALIIIAGLMAFIRSSRQTAVASFVASGLGILFSLILACV